LEATRQNSPGGLKNNTQVKLKKKLIWKGEVSRTKGKKQTFVDTLQTARQLAGGTRQMADCEIYSNISFNKVNCVRYGTIYDAKKRIVLKRVSITDINSKKKDEIIDSFMVV
jgi:hypothetical protein